jgi:putative redox protein
MGVTNATARWTGEKLYFTGIDQKGNEMALGGKDFSPSHLVLLGLAGCTGMDVVSILQKKRQEITDVEVQVIGHNPDQYPKPFTNVEVKYIVKGKGLDPKSVARAIDLSESKYCVVSQSLQEQVEVTTSFEIQEPDA